MAFFVLSPYDRLYNYLKYTCNLLYILPVVEGALLYRAFSAIKLGFVPFHHFICFNNLLKSILGKSSIFLFIYFCLLR